MFTKFRKVERLNPTSGEFVQKLVVVSDDNQEYTLLTDMSVEAIKANRDSLLASVKVIETAYGKCAVFNNTKVLEEF